MTRFITRNCKNYNYESVINNHSANKGIEHFMEIDTFVIILSKLEVEKTCRSYYFIIPCRLTVMED